ncbi:hypothetical protein GS397_03520 [Sphingobium yanoikuyae]|uniref:Chemotaxis protein n=1 Tax=Sphingobium yanoikuyae TaxID=13690 RepID=A0A6P1GCW6_SPHYA|nr:hypothetical protein [Sphingobium yanoikuyae]QHD66228.1 hypothetical protein GS397_03520 [Sphingobium yanoikuyae]
MTGMERPARTGESIWVPFVASIPMRQPQAGRGARQAVQTALLQGENIGYAENMASDRMMQAIGTLERAISRLEQNVASLSQAVPHGNSGIDQMAAQAALQSLDDLIGELRGRVDG